MTNLYRRLLYYGIGFGIGLVCVFFFFNNRGCSWLPENRVKEMVTERLIYIADSNLNILENNACEAVKNNIFATENICNLSSKYSCELIFVSTDKAADPESILGYTKKVAEKICESFNSKNINKKKM